MKIVISSSRFAPEPEIIKGFLSDILEDFKIRVSDDLAEERMNSQEVANIYFCKDHQANQHVSMQKDEINPEIIKADWVIAVVPLNHVGKYTMKEILLAVDSYYASTGGNPILTILNCTDYYSERFPENRTPEKGFRNGSEHPEFDEDNEISIKRLKQLIEERISSLCHDENELREIYLGEYTFDTAGNGLKMAVRTAFKNNYNDQRFRFQKLIGLAQRGESVQEEQLYFDKLRAHFISNDYFPRESVDGNLEQALVNQRKYIIVTGLPGSGKTRALLKLLKSDGIDKHDCQYAFGALSGKNVVVMDKSNVRNVYLRLRHEKENVEYLKRIKKQDTEPYDIYLICDQIKDVFEMLQNRDDLYEFFDIVDECDHIKLIATSLPNAYEHFLARWGDRPNLLPKEIDAAEDEIINIPLISEDQQRDNIQNWINFSLGVDSRVESIGDCIQGLKNYKENIVKGLYEKYESDKTDKLPYLDVLLSSIQTVETFRRDPHLFLPLLIFQKEIIDMHELTRSDAIDKTVRTINYLIKNNVIWAARFDAKGMAVGVDQINNNDFRLSPAKFEDHEDDFICDEEIFLDTKMSTKYVYGVNEIVWEYLKKVDANKHEHKLLFDYNKADEIVESAQLYYNAVKRASTLRRILSRVPYKDNRSEALSRLWSYVYKKIDNLNDEKESIDELNQVIGMLIGQSSGMDDIEKVLELIECRGITPNYSIIGQLYIFGKDKPEDIKKCIEEKVQNIRERYHMDSNTLFSFSREVSFHKLSFNKIIDRIKESQFVNRAGRVMSIQEYAATRKTDRFVSMDLDRTFSLLARKDFASNLDRWTILLELYEMCKLNMTRLAIYAFIQMAAKESNDIVTMINYVLSLLPKEKVDSVKDILPEGVDEEQIGKHSTIVHEDDIEYVFFSAIECSENFKQAKAFFDIYLMLSQKENPRMVSIVLHNVGKYEFQQALLFLQKTEQRYKAEKKPFSSIMYNNLLKKAPNVGEALAVLPSISEIQDYTISNVLGTLKNRKLRNQKDDDNQDLDVPKTDPKLFFYAYDVVMRSSFEKHRTSPSPFVLGLLYNFASTLKQETFIRDKYLLVENEEKKKLIDYSTTVTSLRIKKPYRDIGTPEDRTDTSWGIFNMCRRFYKDREWYINSDLYSNMMRKIYFSFKNDPKRFSEQMQSLSHIIDEDERLIIKDEFFLANRYAYDPVWNKRIFDGDHVSDEFIENMKRSDIHKVRTMNKVLVSIVNAGDFTFSKVWAYYMFIKDCYVKYPRWGKELKPDIYTFTNLFRAVKSKEDYDLVMKELDELHETKAEGFMYAKFYVDALRDAQKRVGLTVEEKGPSSKKEKTINDILGDMKKSCEKNDIITSTVLNRSLRRIIDIINKKDPKVKDRYKNEVYKRLDSEVLIPYEKKLNYDVASRVAMIKLSPTFKEAESRIDFLLNNFDYEEYCYHLTACRELATSVFMSQYNIKYSVAFFDYWKKIMDDIGYEPGDPDSFTEDSDKPKKSQFKDDYDYYWSTRWEHLCREMHDYCFHKCRDNERLKSIKEQIQVFDKYNEKLKDFKFKGKVVDFRAIIREKLK